MLMLVLLISRLCAACSVASQLLRTSCMRHQHKAMLALALRNSYTSPVRQAAPQLANRTPFALQRPTWRQVSFKLYSARPFTIGLETLLYTDTSELPSPYNVLSKGGIHDLYHVEPQSKCMVTADGKPAVDMFMRCAALAVALA